MGLKEQITGEMKEAMKAGDALRLSTLRMLIAGFNNMEIEKRGQGITELEEKDYQAVIKKEVKKRQEAIEAYKMAGRVESQEQEEKELKILSVYLPEQMSEAEVKVVVDAVVAEMGIGPSSPEATERAGNLGAIIGEVKKRTEGRADGGMIAKLVRERTS